MRGPILSVELINRFFQETCIIELLEPSAAARIANSSNIRGHILLYDLHIFPS